MNYESTDKERGKNPGISLNHVFEYFPFWKGKKIK